MNEEKRAILMILSRMMDYPDIDFFQERDTILSFIQESISSDGLQQEVVARVQSLYEIPLDALAKLYVETFDYKEQTNLYLTAHELGDSRKRGFALIQLQKLISESGYDYAGKDLADYIPMLLEFLAVAPDEEKYEKLSQRVAYAIERIMKNLTEDSPYKKILELYMMVGFETPGSEDISALEMLREQADLDELPYPLLYR